MNQEFVYLVKNLQKCRCDNLFLFFEIVKILCVNYQTAVKRQFIITSLFFLLA